MVVLAGILLAAGSGFYASRHLGVNTDTDQMFSASLPWRQRAMALDRAFPQFQGLLVAVIDAKVPEEAEVTARDLTRALAADHTRLQHGEPAGLIALPCTRKGRCSSRSLTSPTC